MVFSVVKIFGQTSLVNSKKLKALKYELEKYAISKGKCTPAKNFSF